MQSVAGFELQVEWHRGSNEMGIFRFGMFPDVDALPHRASGGVCIVSIDAGAMVAILLQNTEPADRSIVPFPSGRDLRGGDAGFASVELGFLFL